ncbi:MAG: histidine--tRNA ligase [Geodermatophilaceae bacterium]|nr:histidine--tRNA ligase [Geodermatophilaceae bacterium]
MRFSAPKGSYDVLPPESAAFLAVRDALSRPAILAGYEYIETPIFEDTALFARGVGESTDVVSKEMYTFEDKGGRSLTLRPEGTAGVMRAVIEHKLHAGQLPVKLWYAGPNFRYERPQHGRYRHFTQVGAEAIGVDAPMLDAEVVALAWDGYRALGLREFRLLLTSLGDSTCRPPYRALLQSFLNRLELDADTRRRVELNPLRVLDDKRPEVQAELEGAPVMVDHLCRDCAEHYDGVRTRLADVGVQWEEAPQLVRGLDYYMRTTFEFVHSGLGSQSAIGGGGRYDGLSAAIGGPELTGIGWALGVDRTLLAMRAEDIALPTRSRVQVYGVPLGAAAAERLFVLVASLRAAGVSADLAYGGRGLKGAMKAADRSGAAYAVVLGDRDIEAGAAALKDLRSGEQIAVPLDALVATIQELLS